MAWIIKGESGKTLDASSHSLDSLNISGCVLQFQSLAYDTLKWTASTADATGAGTIVPDFGQIVELWWDSTRKFRGHVTGVVMAAKQIQIVVNGPWWWMERTNLTEVQTDAQGGTAERHTYVFPTQSLATSIATLIARAITNGVPMTAGSVATIYSVPKMTLTEDTCANALALLFSWCPDAVAWFDYSGSGAPILNVTRRGVAGTITYTIATDAVEIGDITPTVQVRLLRVLQERTFERVGGDVPITVNVRIVTATNRNLEEAIKENQFSEALYYRLNVFPIYLPPLRERKSDILLLAEHFLRKYCEVYGKSIRRISTTAINMMMAYHWPGNVRELENCMERAVLTAADDVIHGYALPPTLQTSEATQTAILPENGASLETMIESYEREIIVDALKKHRGNAAAAARFLQTTARIMNYRIRQLGIDHKSYK